LYLQNASTNIKQYLHFASYLVYFCIMRTIKKRSFCGVSSALDIIGDKWSLLIIRDMLFYKKQTYGDFLKSEEKIATNILADRLFFLESSGIISKEEVPDTKVKYYYKLTQKGLDLMPILFEMLLWSNKYLEISDIAKKAATGIINDREGVIKKLLLLHKK
jgi:DNA-binding HxlR family transcriptional regulator